MSAITQLQVEAAATDMRSTFAWRSACATPVNTLCTMSASQCCHGGVQQAPWALRQRLRLSPCRRYRLVCGFFQPLVLAVPFKLLSECLNCSGSEIRTAIMMLRTSTRGSDSPLARLEHGASTVVVLYICAHSTATLQSF